MNNLLGGAFEAFQKAASDDFSLLGLRILITLWAIFVVILAWHISNKWALAGMFAYEVLP